MTIDENIGRNKEIDANIHDLYYLIKRIKDLDAVQSTAQDPELVKISAEEILELAQEFRDKCDQIQNDLSKWVNQCKKDGTPVFIGYYRVLRDLKDRE